MKKRGIDINPKESDRTTYSKHSTTDKLHANCFE